MKESKPYPVAYAYEEPVIPDDVEYAHIVDGVLQVAPSTEEEIADVERDEVVSMSEFRTMFAKWL